MKKVYINRKTGQKIYTDKELNLKDFDLVVEPRNMKMSSDKIIKKVGIKK